MPSTMAYRLAINTQKPCKYPGCTNNREGFGTYCKDHRLQAALVRLYGWPEGHSIRKNVLAPYRTEVAELVTRNLSHPAIASDRKSVV